MAEKASKKVTVRSTSSGRDDTYDRGGAIIVREGHLGVMVGSYSGAETIAIYAPGEWRHAVVEGSSPA